MAFETFQSNKAPDLTSANSILARKVDGYNTPGLSIGSTSSTAAATAIAIGDFAQAVDSGCVSFGTSAYASGQNAVAIGNGSEASAANEFSVGNTTGITRRITNVADPTNATDAATKGYVDGLAGAPIEIYPLNIDVLTFSVSSLYVNSTSFVVSRISVSPTDELKIAKIKGTSLFVPVFNNCYVEMKADSSVSSGDLVSVQLTAIPLDGGNVLDPSIFPSTLKIPLVLSGNYVGGAGALTNRGSNVRMSFYFTQYSADPTIDFFF